VPRIRRRAWLFFFCHDGTAIDLGQLLASELAGTTTTQIYALSPAHGAEQPITREELDVLLGLPSDGAVEAERLPGDVVSALLGRGLVVAEGGDDFDRRLRDSGWNVHAAAYHFLTRWRGVDIRDEPGEVVPPREEHVRAFLELHGEPPPPFRPFDDAKSVVELPLLEPDDAFARLLRRRRTTRAFDRSRPLPLEELALVLHEVFGAHGYASSGDGRIVTLKRTSPSGGGLHPIEAFPLVTNVAGLEPGIYHYEAERHALELVEPLAAGVAVKLAERFVCGQTYFSSAHALVLFVARFVRSHWKYRRHQKAYASVLLDAGHLSQTLYLVATSRELGAFVTTVINNADIDERLGLDGVDEGTVAVAGIGLAGGTSPFDPVFRPLLR
jgi:putative peptide maturation dehydrogenase